MARRKPPGGHLRPMLARVALAAVLMTGDATAARDRAIMGSGVGSCGNRTANRRGYGLGRSFIKGSQAHQQQTQWVLGFLSGFAMNPTPDSSFDPLRNVNAAGVFAWIDNYCSTHPLETIADAAAAFAVARPR